jgi:hypothetical protein
VDGERRGRLWRLVVDRAERRGFSGWAGVVCEVAAEEVDVDAAAISVRAGTRSQELTAASGPWAERLEELQYTVGEGPGVEAFDSGGPVLVSDLSVEHGRWPGFTDSSIADGLAAVFAFPLRGGAIRLGSLDLYRRRAGGLSPHGLADAAVLADLATTALLTDSRGVATENAPWARADAPGHYDDVNVATGMLAAELHISIEDAFMRLRAHAFSNNLPLLEIARAVLSRNLPAEIFQD